MPVVAREAFGCLSQEGTFLAHVQHIVLRQAQVPPCRVLFQTAPAFGGARCHSSSGAGHGISFCNHYGITVIFCVKFSVTNGASE